jgi:hypothetical protein
MVFLHRQFFKERFFLEIRDYDEKIQEQFMSIFFPDPLKDLFQRIVVHRKDVMGTWAGVGYRGRTPLERGICHGDNWYRY